jgi:hypothetical protein
MIETVRHFRLANGPGSLGPSWGDAGLALAGVSLFRRTDDGFAPRPVGELEALLGAAYERRLDASLVRGLGVAADALNHGDIGRAMIAALHLRLPDLTWEGASRIAKVDERLAKYSPDQPRGWHGRWTSEAGGTAPSAEADTSISTARPAPVANPAPRRSVTPSNSRTNDPGSAVAAANADLLTPVAYNGGYHDRVLAEYAAFLRSKGQLVQTEVRVGMADGSASTRLDLLARDPLTRIVYAVELKTGDRPGFTPSQIIVFPHIMFGESVVALDTKAVTLGIVPGVPLQPIPIILMLQRNNTTGPSFYELDPNKISRYYRGY